MADISQASRQLAATDTRLDNAQDLIPILVPGYAGNDKGAAMKVSEFIKRLSSALTNRAAAASSAPRIFTAASAPPERNAGIDTDGTTLWVIRRESVSGSTVNFNYVARALKVSNMERDTTKEFNIRLNTSKEYLGLVYDGTYLRATNNTDNKSEAWRASDQSRQTGQDITLPNESWRDCTSVGHRIWYNTSADWYVFNKNNRTQITTEKKTGVIGNRYGIVAYSATLMYIPWQGGPSWLSLPSGNSVSASTIPWVTQIADQPFNGIDSYWDVSLNDLSCKSAAHIYHIQWRGLIVAVHVSDGTFDLNRFVHMNWINETPIVKVNITPSSATAKMLIRISYKTQGNKQHNARVTSSTSGSVGRLDLIRGDETPTTGQRPEPIEAWYIHEPKTTSQVTYSLRYDPVESGKHIVSSGASIIVEEI